MFVMLLQVRTSPSLPLAVSEYDSATREGDHDAIMPFESHTGFTVTFRGAQGAVRELNREEVDVNYAYFVQLSNLTHMQ